MILAPATFLVHEILRESGTGCVGDVSFRKPLTPEMFTKVEVDESHPKALVYLKSSPDKIRWDVNCSCVKLPSPSGPPSSAHSLFSRVSLAGPQVDVSELYKDLEAGGFPYGPAFRLLESARLGEDGNVAAGSVRVGEHWACVLDACLHLCGALDRKAAQGYPISMERVSQFHWAPWSAFSSANSWLVICSLRQDIHESAAFNLLAIPPSHGSEACVLIDGVAFSESSRSSDDPVLAASLIDERFQLVEIKSPGKSDSDRHYPVEVTLTPDFSPITTAQPSDAPPVPGQISVSVEFWALNFLDVLAAKGIMPASALGGEFVGIVDNPGPSAFNRGERVAGVCLDNGGLTSLVNVPADFCVAVPADMGSEEAATFSLAFGTAWLAVHWRVRWG
jgi:hypothetical protein